MGLFDTLKKAVATAEPPVNATVPHRATSRPTATPVSRGPERRIIFVGGDIAWNQGMERELSALEPKWEFRRIESAAEAIATLDSEPVHAFILTPQTADDAALTQAVEKHSNQVLRVVVCDGDDRAGLARWNKPGVTPLLKTTDARGLLSNLTRSIRLQSWITDAGMKKLLASLRKLPAIPKLYSQVTAELSSPNGSIETVAKFIAQDPVMTAKILQLVNSAFFALGREISDPQEAVVFLGAERTRSIVLLAGVFSQFEGVNCPGFSADTIWNHSLQVAAFARTIAMTETRNAKTAEAAYTAGLVHDMGKLILAANVPTMCASIESLHKSKQISQRDAELQVLGTTHAELAACLLGMWGLPLSVLEAVAWHHCPLKSDDREFSLLVATHAANVFVHETTKQKDVDVQPEKLDHEFLLSVGLGDRRNEWRTACKIPVRTDEDGEHARARLRWEAKQN